MCPAQLQDNWSADRFAEWGIVATTISMESLPSLADIEEEPSPVQRQRLRAELKRYQDQYDVILVDESHNFRNPRTKRYRALMEIIRGGQAGHQGGANDSHAHQQLGLGPIPPTDANH